MFFSVVVDEVSTSGDDRVFSGGVYGNFFPTSVVNDCFDRSKDDSKTKTFRDFFRRTHCLLVGYYMQKISSLFNGGAADVVGGAGFLR